MGGGALVDQQAVNIHSNVAGRGVAVVLSSGIGDSSEAWNPLFGALAVRSRVLSWDFRGHGRSDRAKGIDGYSREHAIDDLINMIGQAGGTPANPAVLVGHSLGGYLSLCVALRDPKLVKALVLIATGPGFRDPASRAQWNGFVASMSLDPRCDPAARALALQPDDEVMANLGSIRVPTLVLVGSDDRRFLAAKDYFVRKMPDASSMVVEGARHAVHRTHADPVNAAILKFLEARFPTEFPAGATANHSRPGR